jgi:solute carrier family 34 (sodium-dependent phosphate cotransporter)
MTLTTNFTDSNSSNMSSGYYNETICLKKCSFACLPMLKSFGEGGTGLFWIFFSILLCIVTLFGIVKTLSMLICGPIAKGVRLFLQITFSERWKWVAQVILFIVAMLLTVIVQSSNIITGTLVPLCAMGIVSLQRVFVMTLGSNIGTTVTG